MTTRYINEVVKIEGVTLSQIIWSLFQIQPYGYLETVLEANQNLASLGETLPVGTKIRFPLVGLETTEPVRDVVRLWD